MIAAVVAADERGGIGRDGGMLISIPEDLKMFRELTEGHIVVMGRKTFDALPRGPLPNRVNVVITSKAQGKGGLVKNAEGKEYYICDLETMKAWLSTETGEQNKHCFIIGGGVIYKELLSFCKRVYLTRIHTAFENADTWFPDINAMTDWRMTVCGDMKYYGDTPFRFCVYDKITACP